MIANERVVAAIPARGGSKSVPRKNLRDLGGKPLVAWAIEVAEETDAIDRTVVTTDDGEIAQVANGYGAEVVDRPDDLASDDALVVDALRHLVAVLRDGGETAAYLVMLEPTCPLRTSDDIRRCLELLTDRGDEYDSVATFTETEPSPHRLWRLDDRRPEPYLPEANPWLPRQTQPVAYELTGAVYAFEIESLPEEGASLLFGKPGAVLMPRERAIDIDNDLDFEVAERAIKERMHD